MSELVSTNPANGEELWRGEMAGVEAVNKAVQKAAKAQDEWAGLGLEGRIEILRRYQDLVKDHKADLAAAIAQETGKPRWDAETEAGAMAAKVDLSLGAYEERTGSREAINNGIRTRLDHRPHGVMAVFGPYNFPGHLPNGHIVPALLAGNTAVLKPSELTPWTAEVMLDLWRKAGLPDGVLQTVHGGAETGKALVNHEQIAGVLFTGSVSTGRAIAKALAARPEVIVALELGGNNPLIVDEVGDREAAARMALQSAFITSGQRCTCARRLIMPEGEEGDEILDRLVKLTQSIRVGVWDADPQPFMGPLVSAQAADSVMAAHTELKRGGARDILAPFRREEGAAWLQPGIVDVTPMNERKDEEVFGPLLQVVRTVDFEAALTEANNTRYGLAAGLLSDNEEKYQTYSRRIRAGVVNWNRPVPGASGAQPFGGVGISGNHRPSGYYAADYCAWPVARLEDADDRLNRPDLPPGVGDA